MRIIALLLVFTFLLSCKSPNSEMQNDSVEAWIKRNSDKIEKDIELFIYEYQREHKLDSSWVATSYVFTLNSPNTLGQLAKLAGDSNQCVVVELSFSKFLSEKSRLMVVAEDSSCLGKIKTMDLRTDSTDYFVYGVEQKSLN